jgi:hypothetical protein
MKQLGISVYPHVMGLDASKNYIELAAKYGFTRIFTCLLSAGDKHIRETIDDFSDMSAFANRLGMEVVADVAPDVFSRMGVTYQDLSLFKEIGLFGIRLDLGFSGMEESIMTCNPFGLKIELNMSNGTKYVDNIISHQPNSDHLTGCHNFYPHQYTGLDYDHFLRCSRQFKELGLPTAAFVGSGEAKYGPWPVTEGLCTLEMHRHLPIEVQAKHLWATGLIDCIIVANGFASEQELQKLSAVNQNMLELSVEMEKDTPALERRIVLDELHFSRGDVSEYMVRSTQSRVKYKDRKFPVFHTPDMKRGDVLIESSRYDRYAGELQIALKPMKNSGKTNVVGRIVAEEIFLLDFIRPWMKFSFSEKK